MQRFDRYESFEIIKVNSYLDNAYSKNNGPVDLKDHIKPFNGDIRYSVFKDIRKYYHDYCSEAEDISDANVTFDMLLRKEPWYKSKERLGVIKHKKKWINIMHPLYLYVDRRRCDYIRYEDNFLLVPVDFKHNGITLKCNVITLNENNGLPNINNAYNYVPMELFALQCWKDKPEPTRIAVEILCNAYNVLEREMKHRVLTNAMHRFYIRIVNDILNDFNWSKCPLCLLLFDYVWNGFNIHTYIPSLLYAITVSRVFYPGQDYIYGYGDSTSLRDIGLAKYVYDNINVYDSFEFDRFLKMFYNSW